MTDQQQDEETNLPNKLNHGEIKQKPHFVG